VVEFASRIPPALTLKGLREKYILRRSIGPGLPRSIAQRVKQPYRAPDAQIFRGPSAGYVDDLLSRAAIVRAGCFNPDAVEKLARKFRAQADLGTRDTMALVGIVNTLNLSIHERTRELGMLRAVGMSRRQVRRMIRYEALITALVSAMPVNAVARLVNDRPGVVLPSLVSEIGNAEINAFRQAASVVVQKSLHRGFALWLSEAMWQRRPVVAGRTVGTTAQVVDGVTGYLVPTTADCARRIGERWP